MLILKSVLIGLLRSIVSKDQVIVIRTVVRVVRWNVHITQLTIIRASISETLYLVVLL